MHVNQFATELPSDHELTKALMEGFGSLFQIPQTPSEVSSEDEKVNPPEVIYLGGPLHVQ